MAFFQNFARNLGDKVAPFGFSPPQDQFENVLGEYYDPKAARWNAVSGALQGLGVGLMTNDWAKAAEVSSGAVDNYRRQAIMLAKLARDKEDRAWQTQERDRQKGLSSKWSEWVTANRSKFGEYADLAPYLDPGEGMKLLSGMQPDWRPASAEERASLGVGADVPLVITQEGPKVLGNGGTTINMPAMESSYDKELGSGLAKTMLTLQEGRGNAASAINTYDEMEASLNQPGVYTGFGAPTVKGFQQLGAAIGITDPEAIANAEKFEAATNAAIKNEVGSLGAGVSEGDRRFVENANAGLTRTKEGNRLIIGMKRRIAERKIQVADFAQQYAMENGGRLDAAFYSALGEWSAANPMFTPEEQKAILNAGMKGRSKAQPGAAVQDGKGDIQLPDLSTMSDEDLLNALNGGL